MKSKLKKEIISWLKTLIFVVALAFVVNSFLIVNAQVPTGSMESTIMTGDRIIGSLLSYDFAVPQRGDIVLFRFPDDEKQIFLKRIIGLPDECIMIMKGKVYINDADTPLDETYLTVVPVGNFGPYIVPENSYFVMGDNRNVSYDSRQWENTYVEQNKILAKAEFIYFPHIQSIK